VTLSDKMSQIRGDSRKKARIVVTVQIHRFRQSCDGRESFTALSIYSVDQNMTWRCYT